MLSIYRVLHISSGKGLPIISVIKEWNYLVIFSVWEETCYNGTVCDISPVSLAQKLIFDLNTFIPFSLKRLQSYS